MSAEHPSSDNQATNSDNDTYTETDGSRDRHHRNNCSSNTAEYRYGSTTSVAPHTNGLHRSDCRNHREKDSDCDYSERTCNTGDDEPKNPEASMRPIRLGNVGKAANERRWRA